MSELTKKDLEALQRIKAAEAEMDAIPDSEKITISNPDKYDFPLGFDDEGKPFTEEHRKKIHSILYPVNEKIE